MKKRFCTGIVILLILGIALMGLGILLPYHLAGTHMSPDGWLSLEPQPDGGWELSWPAAKGADRYRIELYPVGGSDPLYRNFAQQETTHLLPPIPEDQAFTLCVTPIAEFRTLLGASQRYGETSMTAQVRFEVPALTAFDLSVNGDDKTASLTVETGPDVRWQYTLLDDAGAVLEGNRPSETPVVFRFGDGGSLPLPVAGETCLLQIRAFREEPGAIVYGPVIEDKTITGESLQFRTLAPVLTEPSKNTIQLTWGETRGDHYEVQQLSGETWTTVARVSQDSPRIYTQWVASGETVILRVVAVDHQGQYPVVSEPLEFTGRDMIQYATVWPIRPLAALSSPHGEQIVGYAREGQAYCVLEEKNGMFAVRVDDQVGYIESNYCLINLPEYIGGLCSYTITNSVSSIYTVHDFAIPNVTGYVTGGYENVSQEDGSCLVPLLYPTARKLVRAAEAAREEGYRLKIYDSFRPLMATREVYDLASKSMNTPLPVETIVGIPRSSLPLPEPREGQEELTLGWLMTGRNYELRSFLARDGSAHNLGIAMDLTLEDLETGEEVPMQTRIHDLSHYSVLSENTDMANTLQRIMLRSGFTELVSEWWHFQDNDAKEELRPNPLVMGVSAECWVKDDTGWKYRTPKGRFYAGETVEIGGISQTFDENGYVIQ